MEHDESRHCGACDGHGTDEPVPHDSEQLSPCSLCDSTDRWLHYYSCGHYYGGANLGPPPNPHIVRTP